MGAWTELTSATERAHNGLAVMIGNQLNAARTAATWMVEVGVGAAASETTIVTRLLMACNTNGQLFPTVFPLVPVEIPSGSRVAVRARSQTTDATDRLFDVVLYGVG